MNNSESIDLENINLDGQIDNQVKTPMIPQQTKAAFG